MTIKYFLNLLYIVYSLTEVACGQQTSNNKHINLNPYKYKTSKNITCKNGAVVSAHALASKVGVTILKQGGNAVDAAIATQLALAVVYPGAGNIGGGGFMVMHLKDKNVSIDYREVAPAAASRDMYLDTNGNPQMQLSQDGHLASGVPGTVAGLFDCNEICKAAV